MQQSLDPLPPSACMSDPTTAACGAAMAPLCGGKCYFPGNVDAISCLISPDSNCAIWRTSIQTSNALTQVLAPGSSYLDTASMAYCTANMTAEECACVAFPLLPDAAPFCNIDCGGGSSEPGQCSLQSIAQSNANGTVMVLEFVGCTPWTCWNQACFDTNGLVPTTATMFQRQGLCSNWCVSVQNSNDYTGEPPMAPGSWVVQGGGLIANCGTGSVGPTPDMPESTYRWSANSKMEQTLAMANDGDVPLNISVQSVSVSWAVVEPSTLLVTGRSMELFILSANQKLLASLQAAAPGGVYKTSVTIVFGYLDSTGVAQTYTSVQKLEVYAAHPPVVQQRVVIPSWFPIVSGIAILCALVMIFRMRSAQSFVHKFMRSHGIKH